MSNYVRCEAHGCIYMPGYQCCSTCVFLEHSRFKEILTRMRERSYQDDTIMNAAEAMLNAIQQFDAMGNTQNTKGPEHGNDPTPCR